eukprot:6188585-Pleurochrysis_carterae.AAC.5
MCVRHDYRFRHVAERPLVWLSGTGAGWPAKPLLLRSNGEAAVQSRQAILKNHLSSDDTAPGSAALRRRCLQRKYRFTVLSPMWGESIRPGLACKIV